MLQRQQLLKNQPIPLTETLSFKLLCPEDMDELIQLYQDPDVTEYLWFAPAPDEFFHSYFMPLALKNRAALKGDGEPLPVVVIRDENDQFAGMATLLPVAIAGIFELGYQVAPAYQGQGIATRISRWLVAYGFEVLQAHKITADCYGNNRASERVMQKVGMIKEGHQVGFYPFPGGFDDRLHYGICYSAFN
ncbi:GNAT family N-acetyltransferase [Spongorhabdus nitratireducens]